MIVLRCAAVFAIAVTAAEAEPQTFIFSWTGSGGYSMSGAMAFDTEKARDGLISEADLDCFEIVGKLDGDPIGRWALRQVTNETTWILTFDVTSSAFVVYSPEHVMPQAWNMDGYGENCGSGGFGFNIGNAAQDVCLGGELVIESQAAPSQPFPAERVAAYAFASDACLGPELIGWNGLSSRLARAG